MSNISSEDRQKIEELRQLIKNEITSYYDTDFNLLRWLKGHNYNLDEILPKLRNHLMLRKLFDLDNIADKQRNHPVHYHWKSGLLGPSGEKTPNTLVNIEQTGTNDFWGILHTFSLNEIMKARIYDLEKMLRAVMEQEREKGEQYSMLYIMDLNELKYHANLITLLTGPLASISTFMSENYVELIHSFVLVGVPTFISAIWNIAKPLLPERTRNKVKILGANWRNEILEMASPQSLPSFWNEENKERIFFANIERSIPVDPKDYYKVDDQLKGAELFSVVAGKTGFIDFKAEPGQTLNWKLETDGHFSYAIYFTEDPTETVITNMRLVYPRFNKVPGPTHVPISDSIVCTQTGIYKLWFSNEHAWFHTLRVRHNITLS